MSFASRQFSLDFVQLQFKAYASKLAFLGQETFQQKLLLSGLHLCAKADPTLFVLHAGHLLPHRKTKLSGGAVLKNLYTGTVLEAFQSWP